MSQRWHKVVLSIATWVGGAAAALSSVGFAAALFPTEDSLYEEEVKTIDSSQAAPASLPSSLPASAPVEEAPKKPIGESLGEFKISFYVLTDEKSHQKESYDTPLYKKDGTLIGKFPKRFVSDLRIQGSARLSSGDILAHGGPCEYGPTGICYRILSRKKYPWGQGSTGRPLKLMQSAAIDPRVIPYGVKVYIPELDGVVVQGKTLNGCFSTDDTGGGIRGKEIDLFAGSRSIIAKVKDRIPTLRTTIYRGGPYCGEEPVTKGEKIAESGKVAKKKP